MNEFNNPMFEGYEDMNASDFEVSDKMRPKQHGGMSKQERKQEKDFRKKRKNARGRQYESS